MCGIVGYVGPRACVDLIVGGLRKLEYRGYDSAGVAVVGPEGLAVRRAKGKLANLEALLAQGPLHGTTGIGHTRWATHGRPSDENAHPHAYGGVAVVHNGIIENHLELKATLAAKGHAFSSETDTEIVAHLVAEALDGERRDLAAAVRVALEQVRGSYAIAVVSEKRPGEIVAAKNASPLVVGYGQGENFLASDVPAILEHTRDVVYLEEGELALLTAGGVSIWGKGGAPSGPQASPHRVERGRRREGRPQALHAQGDPRAAAGGGGHHPRPHLARAGRHGPGRPGPRRALRPLARAHRRRGLRHELARRARGTPHDRDARPSAGGGGAGERVPLPRPDRRAADAVPRRLPVRRDRRHPRRGQGGPEARGAGLLDLQRRRAPPSRASATARSTPTPGRRSASPPPRPSPPSSRPCSSSR